MNQLLKVYAFFNRDELELSTRIELVAADMETQARGLSQYRHYFEIPGLKYDGARGIIISFEPPDSYPD